MSRRSEVSKRRFIYIGIGLMAVLVASTFAIIYPQSKQSDLETERVKGKEYLCGSRIPNSNKYVKEFVTITECSEPVAITLDNNGNVWFAESAARKIGMFDPLTERFEEYALPDSTNTKVAPIASIWSMKFKGTDLWFTDAVANAIWKFDTITKRFEKYPIPSTSDFGTAYPINLEISDDYIWFSEIYGKKIGRLDPLLAENNASKGIEEFDIDVDLETLGPLAIDDDNNIWFTALTYPVKGEIIKFDPSTREITRYDLPKGISSSPVGIAINEQLWINDHGGSLFFLFDPANNSSITFSTSLPVRETSIGIYEQCLKQQYGNPSTCGGMTVSLPYWNAIDDHGRIWFNEHQGNAIAVFDPESRILVEYLIPTHNPRWGACDGYSETCGISNPLQFALANDRVWFTEWTESKIGVIDTKIPIPFSLETDNSHLLKAGEKNVIDLSVNATEPLTLEMRLAGTITSSGRIFNMTANFSEQILEFDNPSTKKIRLELIPEENLKGDYRLTISARHKDVIYSKIVDVRVI